MKNILFILSLIPSILFGQQTMRQVAASGTSITRLPIASSPTVTGTDTVIVFKGGAWIKTSVSAIKGTTVDTTHFWNTKGNSGTTAGTNFVGTTDNIDLYMKTNNTSRSVINKIGNFALGTTNFSTYSSDVNNQNPGIQKYNYIYEKDTAGRVVYGLVNADTSNKEELQFLFGSQYRSQYMQIRQVGRNNTTSNEPKGTVIISGGSGASHFMFYNDASGNSDSTNYPGDIEFGTNPSELSTGLTGLTINGRLHHYNYVGVGTGNATVPFQLGLRSGGVIPINTKADFLTGNGDGWVLIGGQNGGARGFKIGQTAAGYAVIQGFRRSDTLFKDISFQTEGGNVGIGTLTPDASSKLDCESTTEGFLEPQMTTTQKNAIGSPKEGLQVYDATLHAPFFYNGAVWNSMNGWSVTGNAGTTPGTNFIGTIDNEPLQFNVNNTFSGIIDNTNQNTFFGFKAGFTNSGVTYNTSFGFGALQLNVSGVSNCAFGRLALNNSTTSNNTAFGSSSLYNLTGGANCTSVGEESQKLNSSGNNCTSVGMYSGFTNQSGTGNSSFGYGADQASSALSNATAIGYNCVVQASNHMALGNSSVTGMEVNSDWGLHVISTPTTTSTVTLTVNETNIVNPAGTIAALTLLFPASPTDGNFVEVKFEQIVTTVTYTAGTGGATIKGQIQGTILGSAMVGFPTKWVYDSGTNTWY